ncbi:hypothetical protein KSP40_PGU021623 [Platanthera guangdongensis]|uniref:Uncharacterized protein n=1 Tax=Platanthera guangdongensis TaxID=2320717 RepID=A0ABR2MVZ5_9ASPA
MRDRKLDFDSFYLEETQCALNFGVEHHLGFFHCSTIQCSTLTTTSSFQMLSMRNGLNLHDMYLSTMVQSPVQASEICMGFNSENRIAMNMGQGMLTHNHQALSHQIQNIVTSLTAPQDSFQIPIEVYPSSIGYVPVPDTYPVRDSNTHAGCTTFGHFFCSYPQGFLHALLARLLKASPYSDSVHFCSVCFGNVRFYLSARASDLRKKSTNSSIGFN